MQIDIMKINIRILLVLIPLITITACFNKSSNEQNIENFELINIDTEIRYYLESQLSSDEKIVRAKANTSKNKIVAITKNASKEFDKSFVKTSYFEKLGGKWIELQSFKLSEEFVLYFPMDTIELIQVENTSYYLTQVEVGHLGTANNGLDNMKYIFYNIRLDSVVTIDYYRWNQKPGEFSIDNGKKSNFKHLISFLNKNKIKESDDKDLNSQENFYLKWLSLNRGLYDLVYSQNGWSEIVIPTYSKEFFFSRLASDPNYTKVFTKYGYLAIAGFANPIIAYSKKEDVSYVLWIPSGWPNGGAWGTRSFEIIGISRYGIVKAKMSNNIILEIDIKNRVVRLYEM
jgi:hypothetical protein